jgi:lytic murein transglycosylase
VPRLRSLLGKLAIPLGIKAGVVMLVSTVSPVGAQAGFRAFLEGVWPDAQKLGVTRPVFDAATRDLTPDLTLPDLILPGRERRETKGQAEFIRPPQEYLNHTSLARLAEQGRALATKHAGVLKRIETEIGVERHAVLAIWGRETAYGTYKLPHDAVRVLATQAYLGRRKDMFRDELLAALKMLQDGLPRERMRASWAGAMGLTQFMPSEFGQHGIDMDQDGKIDLFQSVPDALASAAQQLKAKGWVTGLPWGYEVRRPANADCALEGPGNGRTIAEWVKLGYSRAHGLSFTPRQLAGEAYLMQPAGTYGPAFLVTENFKVIRRYNTSDLYALFVGNLTDRIAGRGDFEAPWADPRQLATRDIEEVQRQLQAAGHTSIDRIDGKIGSATRAEIGAFQNKRGMKADCWPTAELLQRMRAAGAAPALPQ